MKEPICKIADIIYVRFELEEFEAQKKYLNHFGMILAHENENSIFLDAEISKELAGFSDVLIDIGDHTKEGGDSILLILVKVEVFLRAVKRTMGSICGNVS